MIHPSRFVAFKIFCHNRTVKYTQCSTFNVNIQLFFSLQKPAAKKKKKIVMSSDDDDNFVDDDSDSDFDM